MVKKNFFDGKVVLITGSTRGIGLAIAKAFSNEGALIGLNGRDERVVKEAMKDVPNSISAEIEFGTSFIASFTTRSSRPFRPINAPSLENALAIANPIPRVLPVIKTTLPSKKFFFTIIYLVPFLLKRTFFFQAVK